MNSQLIAHNGMVDLQGKNILITGASSGIGEACALLCNRLGARVHIMGRDLDRLRSVFSKLNGPGNSYHTMDLIQCDDYQEIIGSIVAKYGRLNGFIHSAGIQITLPFRSMNPKQYHDIMQVNVVSAFEISRHIASKRNHEKGKLSIVLIASTASIVSGNTMTSYSASKAALVGGSKAMSVELASSNVRVNCVSPGYVQGTGMVSQLSDILEGSSDTSLSKNFPLGLGKTSDVSSMCAFLISEEAKWITGQNIVLDGGLTSM